MRCAVNSKGFTLLELSIIILIMGFLLIPIFRTYDTYLYDKRTRETRENLTIIQNELSIFLVKHRRYPRPAIPELASTDERYGVEITRAEADLISVGAGCGPSGFSSVCKYAGDRDRDGVTGMDPILVGSVPFVTLSDTASTAFRRISKDQSLDGWKNKLTYAVTDSQTGPAQFNHTNGVISVIDTSTPPRPIGDVRSDAHYVLLSHGKDGVGAYTQEGTRLTLCTSGIYGEPDGPPATPENPAGSVAKADLENCNPNGRFAVGLDYSESDGPGHYDDFLTYGKSSRSGLWAAESDSSGDVTKNYINLNSGNVGIGLDPEVQLHVDGTIRAESRVRTSVICEQGGTANCFDISILAGPPVIPPTSAAEASTPGIRCAQGRAMVGINGGQEDCEDFALPSSGWVAQTCPPGRWLRGVRNNGTIECTN